MGGPTLPSLGKGHMEQKSSARARPGLFKGEEVSVAGAERREVRHDGASRVSRCWPLEGLSRVDMAGQPERSLQGPGVGQL